MVTAFCMHDPIMDVIIYDDLVLMAKNINPKRENVPQQLRTELERLIATNRYTALELFDEHAGEIMAAAFQDEQSQNEKNPLGDERTASLAKNIYEFLLKHDIWVDVSIYFDGICWSTSNKEGENHRYNSTPHIYEADPHDWFAYVGPILSMSFEGPLYEILNGYADSTIITEFNKIFERYGTYYELGDAWNLTVAE